MNIFQQFLRATGNGTHKLDGLYIGELTHELIDKYIKWRRDFKNNSDATINHSLTPILKGCEAACKMGLIDLEINAMLQDMHIQEKVTLESRLFNVATSRAKSHTIIIADKNILSFAHMNKDVRNFLEKLSLESCVYILANNSTPLPLLSSNFDITNKNGLLG